MSLLWLSSTLWPTSLAPRSPGGSSGNTCHVGVGPGGAPRPPRSRGTWDGSWGGEGGVLGWGRRGSEAALLSL